MNKTICNTFKILTIFLLALTLSTGTPALAYEKKIKELFDKDMPQYPEIPEDEFIENPYLQADMPFGDKALAYEIRLPTGWKSPDQQNLTNYNLSSRLLGDVATFYSPPRIESVRSRFQIQALRLEYQITAEQWLLQHVLANGYTLEGLEYFEDEDKVGSLHVFLDDGETYVARTISQINGKRMIQAQYIVPANQWNKEASIIAQSLKTFKLLNQDDTQIETMHQHLFLDIAKFSYPASWKLKSQPIRTIDRISATISNLRANSTQALDGQIDVNLVSAYSVTDLEEELNDLKMEFRKKGLVIDNLIDTIEEFEFQDVIEFGFIDLYNASDAQNKSLEYEIWIGVVALGNYYGFITLMSPSRDDEFFTWSRNVSAFETTLKSLDLQAKKIGQSK